MIWGDYFYLEALTRLAKSWYSFGNSWRKTLKIINSGGSTNEILEKGLTAAALLAVTAVTLTACGGSSERKQLKRVKMAKQN